MEDKITLLAGVEHPDAKPLPPFSELAIDFLDALSRNVRAASRAPELAAFGFWCRRAHVLQLRERYDTGAVRLGRGLAFHVAPANVPAMFAYSYAVGLLAGNANVVRVSERAGETARELCEVIRTTLEEPRFAPIRDRTAILSYVRNDAVTAKYMSDCDAAVIWGGDETVRAMQRFPMKPNEEFLAFPDRRSMAVFSRKALSEANSDVFHNYVHRFYNDTYVMDQNACSSPQLVLWLNDGGDGSVRERFWTALAAEAEASAYPRDAYRAARKYERACLAGMTEPSVSGVRRYGGNLLYVLTLSRPPEDPDALRGGFGLFYEAEVADFGGVLPYVTERLQTVACIGVDRASLATYLAEHGARGADRIVEAGHALSFDPIWDGKDLIARLSREICIS